MTNQQHLKQKLWDIANDLRGKMGADEFRDYMLGFIFFKYLSEKMLAYANKALEPDGLKYSELDGHAKREEYVSALKPMSLNTLGYFLEPHELFSAIVKRADAGGTPTFILGDLQKVLNHITQSTMGTESEEDFENLFEDLDLTSSKLGKTEEDKNELIVKVMSHLDQIDFQLDNPENDVLGDAYEYLIGQFASGAGKKAGEFYTPQEVSSVLAKLVTTGKKRLRNVYDPTCGSGSLLLRVAREVEEVGDYFGQESNPTTYNLCRMNMIMHDVHFSRFDIKNEDTLERPQHLEQRFEAVVANPPFSARWSSDPLKMNDERFSSYGKLAPKTKADFAFVQHMLYQLDETGTMACVLPHGVLFRGSAEGHIREYLIKELNVLDAVIGLPANIFYGTGIPTCVLVLRKQRAHPEHVLFIDASGEDHYEKVKTQNRLRPQDIDKIITTYREFVQKSPLEKGFRGVSEDKYSYITNREEIAENDYNLNIPRYVDTFEEEEPVDLEAVAQELRQLEQDMKETDTTIADYCKQLGIEAPF
ncbi:MAG: type I restriction-modification system subunit M [Balneolaceae bacterium]|nr:type I restriction-modification system subunit M [Balneolaceae bacterium]